MKQTNNKTASPGDDVAIALENSQQLWVPAQGQACLKSNPVWIGKRPVKPHH